MKNLNSHSAGRLLARLAVTLTRLIFMSGTAMTLLAFGVVQAASSGPAFGGNTLTITRRALGNGSDITNVTICGVEAAIRSQTADSVTVVVGAGGSGTGNILVFSASVGVTTFTDGYTYKPLPIRAPVHGWLSASNGPATGGNTLTIRGTGMGNGSDITNVTICGVTAAIQNQTSNSVTVIAGVASDGGRGDINVYSGRCETTFRNGYAYNPPGSIFGAFAGWSQISTPPWELNYFGAASVDGKIYVIGGEIDAGYTSAVSVYDSAQPSMGWLNVSNLPAPRAYLASATVNGKIYAIGGYDGNSVQSTVYVYDPSQPAQGWLSVSNLPQASDRVIAVGASGKLYVIGEHNNDINVYDPARPQLGWVSAGKLPWNVTYAITAASVNGKIYVMGKKGSGAFVYDPSRPGQGWLSLSNLPPARAYYNPAAVSVNEKIYVMNAYRSYARAVYAYDPGQPAEGWLSANLPAARSYLAAMSANGNVFIIESDDGDPIGNPSTAYEGSFASGVVQSSGPLAGGNTVTISGNNLGNGDVTNVTLCGIPATILADNSPTQLVVSAGAAIIGTNGDVVVNSASYGITVRSNAYSYLSPPAITTSNSLPPVAVEMTYAFDGTNLQLSWPTNCLGWWLEAQTNGLGGAWFPLGGSTATNQFLILINPANGSVFYRLHQQ